LLRTPVSTLFPYTTLFRSGPCHEGTHPKRRVCCPHCHGGVGGDVEFRRGPRQRTAARLLVWPHREREGGALDRPGGEGCAERGKRARATRYQHHRLSLSGRRR